MRSTAHEHATGTTGPAGRHFLGPGHRHRAAALVVVASAGRPTAGAHDFPRSGCIRGTSVRARTDASSRAGRGHDAASQPPTGGTRRPGLVLDHVQQFHHRVALVRDDRTEPGMGPGHPARDARAGDDAPSLRRTLRSARLDPPSGDGGSGTRSSRPHRTARAPCGRHRRRPRPVRPPRGHCTAASKHPTGPLLRAGADGPSVPDPFQRSSTASRALASATGRRGYAAADRCAAVGRRPHAEGTLVPGELDRVSAGNPCVSQCNELARGRGNAARGPVRRRASSGAGVGDAAG